MLPARKNPKPIWKQGRELPPFSRKTWWELQDQWPADVRMGSECYKVMSVIAAAKVTFKAWFEREFPNERPTLEAREIEMLFWIHRCQEAKEGVATESFWMGYPLHMNATLLETRKARITRMGLIEKIPVTGIRIYRVTGKGIMVMRAFIERLEEAHRDLPAMVARQPEKNAKRVDRQLRRFVENWDKLAL